jgi:osmoprotectant transport system permease protein
MQSMTDKLEYLLSRLPDYLGGHMLISITALVVGLVLSVPLGIAASRRPKLAEWLLGIAGILQTVPTVALLAIMVPVMGGAIGFAPAFVALMLYSILPILANTITGLRGIDPVLNEAARGLGMSDWQMLLRVQLPLSAPVILSGIRTATVLVVGTATLATSVGGLSLGNYIFSGLEMSDMNWTIFGCVVAALLAIVLDQLVHVVEIAVRRRSKVLAWGAAAGLLVVVAGGLYRPITRIFLPPVPIVASAPFTEQHILSEVITQKMRDAGLDVDQRQGMGETFQFIALKHNQIDCCINYTGNIWVTLMHQKGVASPETTYAETTKFLKEKYDVECLGRLGFENAYVLAMKGERAQREGIVSIGDLAKHPGKFVVGGDMQFAQRDEWKHVCDTYRLQFKEIKQMTPTLMYGAKDVDVICAYLSDGRLTEHGFTTLADPKKAFPPYDAIVLLSQKGAQNTALREALTPLVERVDLERMRRANLRVDVEKQSPRTAARELLAEMARQ